MCGLFYIDLILLKSYLILEYDLVGRYSKAESK